MVNILVPTLPPFHFLSLNMWEKTDDSFASRRLSFPAVSQATPRAAAAAAGIPLHARTQAPGRPPPGSRPHFPAVRPHVYAHHGSYILGLRFSPIICFLFKIPRGEITEPRNRGILCGFWYIVPNCFSKANCTTS